MLHSILVAVDGSPTSLSAARYAALFAKAFECKLRGLYVVDVRMRETPLIRDLVASTGLMPFQEYQPRLEELMETRADTHLAALRDIVVAEGLEIQLEKQTGLIEEVIVKRAMSVDLLVMGQRGEHAQHRTDGFGTTAEAVLRRSSRPVLLCPDDYRQIMRPLVAYDGSDKSSRALALGAQIAERLLLPLRILAVADNERSGEEVLHEAIDYMDSTRADYEAFIRLGDPAEEIVLCQREKLIDLMLMGAYGHGRLVKWLLGSVTEDVMKRVATPLLVTR
ncbi:MAG: universal stress protein [Candidatus Schekmanbacteria bacterium]|nr:universal stress protein [Candidatus Schekmanbacteria bacterium]